MTRNFSRKVRGVGPLLGIIALGLALAACGSSNQTGVAASGDTAAVAVSGNGVTVDVLTTGAPWQGGFPGAVRITNTASASPIASFEVVFKLATGSVTGAPWNGNITGPDASGNYTATNPPWLQYQPIQRAQTWDVGFNGAGTFTSSTIVSLKINGQVVPIGGTDAPPSVSLASSAATVTTASSITLTAAATDDVGVARVEFYEGTTLLASDTTAPYTTAIAFTSANNGAHTYTARAYDTA
ncbi:MAG TPA: Ig-like domain-containing protein, partial [Anaeromyxobacter sp.]|nr:Ig-like domain-containing protein [Anaeromyxobacter sp.]